jgi:hypothetical protein
MSLADDLQQPITSLDAFADITRRVLRYLEKEKVNRVEAEGYAIIKANVFDAEKFIRPLRMDLFVFSADEFDQQYHEFLGVLDHVATGLSEGDERDRHVIDSTVYTLQRSVGLGLDLLAKPNSARKHVGNRFEELVELVFQAIGVHTRTAVFKIPYPVEKGEAAYTCETDLVLSRRPLPGASDHAVADGEVIVSIKTSSKDRMGKIFLDKMLLEKFTRKKIKLIGVFLGDVQRSGEDDVSFTLVSGLFMVYTRFLIEIDEVVYVDPPPKALVEPWSNHISGFSDLLLRVEELFA